MAGLSQSLSGIRVLEFSHAILGPSCGLILADLGAEVIKVEPSEGDPTRFLKGFGSGFFTFYNRNKKSLALDLKTPEGIAQIYQLLAKTDVVIENFAPGTMDRLGLGYEKLAEINPRLIYCALKGFLSGPYEQRMALDEVVQMMCGLAYMTGLPGRPMRAGASVIDVLTGTFGAVGILAALHERESSGRGCLVKSGLFETGAFLMGQHLVNAALQGGPLQPMSERVSAWAIYDLFNTQDETLVFVGVTSDSQWQRFCASFHRSDLAADSRLNDNSARIAARPWLIPNLQAMFAQMSRQEIIALCDQARIPFAQVDSPEALFRDPHMVEGGHLVQVRLPNGATCGLPALPLNLNETGANSYDQPPQLGQHNRSIFEELGIQTLEVSGEQENCKKNSVRPNGPDKEALEEHR